LGQSLRTADIEPLVGPVAPQRPQMLATMEIADVDGPVIAATGQHAPIGTHSKRLDCPLMPLPKRQALPALHVPPAHAPIAAATEQHRSSRTPGQRVHDRARLPPGLQALPTGHLPDEDLPTASSAPTATGQPRAIGTPGHAHDPATMPPEALHQPAGGLHATPYTVQLWPRSTLGGVLPAPSQMVSSRSEPALASWEPPPCLEAVWGTETTGRPAWGAGK